MTGRIAFTKMHGLGNDFVVLDGVSEPRLLQLDDPARWARRVCDRRTGIGADGVIVVSPGGFAGEDVTMRIINADGTEGDMCGNGIRCVAKLAHERLGIGAERARRGWVMVGTRLGVRAVEVVASGDRRDAMLYAVDMGEPRFGAAAVGADESKLGIAGDEWWSLDARGRRAGANADVAGAGDNTGRAAPGDPAKNGPELSARLVSMGNPHAVIDAEVLRWRGGVERVGPMVERHEAFGQRINAQFVHWIDDARVKVVTWERGAGATAACGTGACAAVAAGIRYEGRSRDVLVELRGGELRVRWDERTGRMLMTGPAAESFCGECVY